MNFQPLFTTARVFRASHVIVTTGLSLIGIAISLLAGRGIRAKNRTYAQRREQETRSR